MRGMHEGGIRCARSARMTSALRAAERVEVSPGVRGDQPDVLRVEVPPGVGVGIPLLITLPRRRPCVSSLS